MPGAHHRAAPWILSLDNPGFPDFTEEAPPTKLQRSQRATPYEPSPAFSQSAEAVAKAVGVYQETPTQPDVQGVVASMLTNVDFQRTLSASITSAVAGSLQHQLEALMQRSAQQYEAKVDELRKNVIDTQAGTHVRLQHLEESVNRIEVALRDREAVPQWPRPPSSAQSTVSTAPTHADPSTPKARPPTMGPHAGWGYKNQR